MQKICNSCAWSYVFLALTHPYGISWKVLIKKCGVFKVSYIFFLSHRNVSRIPSRSGPCDRGTYFGPTAFNSAKNIPLQRSHNYGVWKYWQQKLLYCICYTIWIDWHMTFGLEQEGGILIAPMALAHLLHPIDNRSKNRRRNLWIWWCVSSWWPLFPSRSSVLIYIYMQFIFFYMSSVFFGLPIVSFSLMIIV